MYVIISESKYSLSILQYRQSPGCDQSRAADGPPACKKAVLATKVKAPPTCRAGSGAAIGTRPPGSLEDGLPAASRSGPSGPGCGPRQPPLPQKGSHGPLEGATTLTPALASTGSSRRRAPVRADADRYLAESCSQTVRPRPGNAPPASGSCRAGAPTADLAADPATAAASLPSAGRSGRGYRGGRGAPRNRAPGPSSRRPRRSPRPRRGRTGLPERIRTNSSAPPRPPSGRRLRRHSQGKPPAVSWSAAVSRSRGTVMLAAPLPPLRGSRSAPPSSTSSPPWPRSR